MFHIFESGMSYKEINNKKNAQMPVMREVNGKGTLQPCP